MWVDARCSSPSFMVCGDRGIPPRANDISAKPACPDGKSSYYRLDSHPTQKVYVYLLTGR